MYVDGAGRMVGTAGTNRPDVGAAFNGWGNAHGYDLTVTGVAPGSHQVCTYGLSVLGGANATLGCRSVLVS